jgi:hypothetical protein
VTTINTRGKSFVVNRKRDKYDFVWTATCEQPISDMDAHEVQRLSGFDAAGYGLYDFKCKQEPTGTLYMATWISLTSSD